MIGEEWEPRILIPNLPNDVALICLARVPRQDHRTLSAVSKPIRAAVSSPEFFKLRSRHGVMEDIIYFRFQSPFHAASTWFTLHRRDSLLVRARIPSLHTTDIFGSATAALAGKIYLCGGWVMDPAGESSDATADVWVLDCRSNTWSRGPSMNGRRGYAAAVVISGRLYVVGNCGARGESPFAEVLDPSEDGGRWEALPAPNAAIKTRVYGVAAEGCVLRACVSVQTEVRFNTAAWRWEEPPRTVSEEDSELTGRTSAMVGGVMCGTHGRVIKQFDLEAQLWKGLLEGADAETLKSAIKVSWLGPKLVNVGEKLVVMTVKGPGRPEHIHFPSRREEDGNTFFEAWCTEIDVSNGRIVRSEKVFELLPPPASHLPQWVRSEITSRFMSNWNLLQVSL